MDRYQHLLGILCLHIQSKRISWGKKWDMFIWFDNQIHTALHSPQCSNYKHYSDTIYINATARIQGEYSKENPKLYSLPMIIQKLKLGLMLENWKHPLGKNWWCTVSRKWKKYVMHRENTDCVFSVWLLGKHCSTKIQSRVIFTIWDKNHHSINSLCPPVHSSICPSFCHDLQLWN
jgi:hypothetical protein